MKGFRRFDCLFVCRRHLSFFLLSQLDHLLGAFSIRYQDIDVATFDSTYHGFYFPLPAGNADLARHLAYVLKAHRRHAVIEETEDSLLSASSTLITTVA